MKTRISTFPLTKRGRAIRYTKLLISAIIN
nr:MAG TPA: hypothetical protein [Caudoviricetes sp.]